MTLTRRTRNASLSLLLTLVLIPLAAQGLSAAPVREDGGEQDPLVGVWETVAPAGNDCVTGMPVPDSPIIRVLQKFNQDGTMTEENTDPIEGPYRTTAHGLWERVDTRQYRTLYVHYGFAPDKTHVATIKVISTITLSRNSRHFREEGTFEVSDAQGQVFYTGCFNSGDAPTRLGF